MKTDSRLNLFFNKDYRRHLLPVIFILTGLLHSPLVFSISNVHKYKNCQNCHNLEYKHWKQSDHFKAMEVATVKTVKGDFDNIEANHFGQKAFFYTEENQYKVNTSYRDTMETYVIKYTFGYFPLQQYLVDTGAGKLQVLPFAWDDRDSSVGGQIWYHNYNNEEIKPQDRLHWKQPLQNWNGMCADCHSSGLKRNFNDNKNSFNTTSLNINVGCYSCHGEMTHQHGTHTNLQNGFTALADDETKRWVRELSQPTARLNRVKSQDDPMDKCFACHSLRSPLTDGFNPGISYLDQFLPQLLQAPMYYADGQIKDEVYVYGSFLQSKMYKAGVNCMDCHDKHSMKVKFDDNNLCPQCYSPEKFNSQSHHGHQTDSIGAQCINCHMPENTYMGIDNRRDHSFRIPRPDISEQFSTPNPCLSCHKDKSNLWSEKKLTQWQGHPTPLPDNRINFMALQNGQIITLKQHLDIIFDSSINAIIRATAIQLLYVHSSPIQDTRVEKLLTHSDPLIRISLAFVIHLLNKNLQGRFLAVLLNDKKRAVRVSAARTALNINTKVSLQSLKIAFDELDTMDKTNSWRGEGLVNRALTATSRSNLNLSEELYLKSIKIDPYFTSAYINLSEIYRQTHRDKKSRSILHQGTVRIKNSAELHYSFGLSLIREKKYSESLTSLEKATKLTPQNPRYVYVYALSLDKANKTSLAIVILKQSIKEVNQNTSLKELLAFLVRKNNH